MDPKSTSFVRETILGLKPEVVALELDEGRLIALENPGKSSGRGGGGSFLAMMLLERFAGEMTGSPPGQEMLRAVEAARAVGARVAFVDLPIGMTVGSLRKLPLREKVRLGVDSLVSIALLPFGGFNLSKLAFGLTRLLASPLDAAAGEQRREESQAMASPRSWRMGRSPRSRPSPWIISFGRVPRCRP